MRPLPSDWHSGLFVSRSFYTQERLASPRVDYGRWWWEGQQGSSEQYELVLFVATKELVAFQRGTEFVVVVAAVESQQATDDLLAGWETVCGAPCSLGWVLERVRPVSTFLLRPADVGGHISVAVFAGEQPGQRAHTGVLTLRPGEWDALRRILELGDVNEAVTIAPMEDHR